MGTRCFKVTRSLKPQSGCLPLNRHNSKDAVKFYFTSLADADEIENGAGFPLYCGGDGDFHLEEEVPKDIQSNTKPRAQVRLTGG